MKEKQRIDPDRRRLLGLMLHAPGLFLPDTLSQSNLVVTYEDERIGKELSSFLTKIITNPPAIDGIHRYNKPLKYGIGFATLHNRTFETLRVNNYRGINLKRASRGTKNEIRERCTTDFSRIGISEALNSQKYAGLIALRSPENIGQEFGVFSVSPPDRSDDIKVNFIGPSLVVDTAAYDDWARGYRPLCCQRYRYLGWRGEPWRGLQWMADVSPSIMSQLEPGVSNNPDHINEGRGLILMNKQITLPLLNTSRKQKHKLK
jgi:hypothetical protein